MNKLKSLYQAFKPIIELILLSMLMLGTCLTIYAAFFYINKIYGHQINTLFQNFVRNQPMIAIVMGYIIAIIGLYYFEFRDTRKD